MAVFTFSTKGSKPTDTEAVEEIKQHCVDNGLNFSHLMLQLALQWHKENLRDGE